MHYPKNYEELTTGQYIALANWDGLDFAELLESWSGEDYDLCLRELENLPVDVFDWMDEDIPAKLNAEEIPNKLKIKGEKVKIQKDLAVDLFGKKMYVANIIKAVNLKDTEKDKSLELINNIPLIVAVYLCDKYYPEYSGENVEKLRELLLEMPAREVYPVALFFFRKFKNLMPFKPSSLVSGVSGELEEALNARN